MLKIWLNPNWDKLNHLLRNQMPRGFVLFNGYNKKNNSHHK